MAVGLQNFAIKLERQNKTFAPGETIVGQIIVQLGKPKTVRGLKIRFKGKGKTSFTIGKHTYEDSEEYVRMQFYLVGDGVSEEVEIETGCHIFPFNFVLPPNIPSSFEWKHAGHIRYEIKAIIDRAWKIDHETSQAFFVGTPNYDVSHIASAMLPQSRDIEVSFCCFPFCCDTSSMYVNIDLPKSGYNVGEIIPAKITLANNSTSANVTRVTLRLEQIVTAFADTEERRKSTIIGYVAKQGPFSKKDKFTVRMQVPNALPSSFPHSKLFDISYHLKVLVLSDSCCSDMKCTLPIIIGTIPVVSSQPVSRSSMTPLAPTVEPTAPEYETQEFLQPNPVALNPIEADTSTMEIQPPSYDDCMKKLTNEKDQLNFTS